MLIIGIMFGIQFLAKCLRKQKKKAEFNPTKEYYERCLTESNERQAKIIEDYNRLVDTLTEKKKDVVEKAEQLTKCKESIKTLLADKLFNVDTFKSLCDECTLLMEQLQSLEQEMYTLEVEVNGRYAENEEELNRLKMDIKFYTCKIHDFEENHV